jgi:hypothetical protein
MHIEILQALATPFLSLKTSTNFMCKYKSQKKHNVNINLAKKMMILDIYLIWILNALIKITIHPFSTL